MHFQALAKSGCKLIKWVNVMEKPDEKDLMLAVLANMTKRKLTVTFFTVSKPLVIHHFLIVESL
jgi:hypothetical protein